MILSITPDAYYAKLDNEYWNNRMREEEKKRQPIINAQIEMYKAQAEYYRAEAERIRNANRRKQHS